MNNLDIQMQPQLRKMLYKKAAMSNIPISGTFELTPRCNMNCRMCYIRMTEEEVGRVGREYTTEEWIEMGRVCRDSGMLFLLLTGGEPFLRKDFRKIYEELNKMGLLLAINSNGTMITEDTVRWLKECPPVKISITLYGASDDIYEELCGNPRGFTQVKKAIDLLVDAGINVGISASFTPYNVKDMDAIYEFAKERKLPVKTNIYMFPPLRKELLEPINTIRFSSEEAGRAMYCSKKCQMSEKEFEFFRKCIEMGKRIPNDSDECTYVPDEKMGCVAGRSSFCITWDGRMLPCGLMNFPVARPFEDGFKKSWDFIVKETDNILLPAECTKCSNRFACNICGAMTMAEGNGVSTKKPEYVCGMTEAYISLCTGGKEKEYER